MSQTFLTSLCPNLFGTKFLRTFGPAFQMTFKLCMLIQLMLRVFKSNLEPNVVAVLTYECSLGLSIATILGFLCFLILIYQFLITFRITLEEELQFLNDNNVKVMQYLGAAAKAGATSAVKYGVPMLKTGGATVGATMGVIACADTLYTRTFKVSPLETAGRVYKTEISVSDGLAILKKARSAPEDPSS